jgi:hypothetical protein
MITIANTLSLMHSTVMNIGGENGGNPPHPLGLGNPLQKAKTKMGQSHTTFLKSLDRAYLRQKTI